MNPSPSLGQLIALANALTPWAPVVQSGIIGVEQIIGAIRGVVPDAEVDADLRALIVSALAAKAEADRAAAGDDPQ
jgi:hypothetical protein